MEDFVLQQTDGPAVAFKGELKASASSRRNNAYRWTELHAYVTEGGSWIVQEVGKTTFEGEIELLTIHVFKSEEAMTLKLGHTKLSMKLYERLGTSLITIA